MPTFYVIVGTFDAYMLDPQVRGQLADMSQVT